MLYRIDIWPARNWRLTQCETNHYKIHSSMRKRFSLVLPCWTLARTNSRKPFCTASAISCMCSIPVNNPSFQTQTAISKSTMCAKMCMQEKFLRTCQHSHNGNSYGNYCSTHFNEKRHLLKDHTCNSWIKDLL